MGRKLFGVGVALTLVAAGGAAQAEYPEKSIVVINPNSVGGGTDVGIRTWQPFVEACLGEGASLLPEAHPGAASAVGITVLAQAEPDGYTIGSANMPNLVSSTLQSDVPYTIDSFEYLGNIVGVRSTLNVRTDSELQTLEDVIAHAKESGGTVNVAMGGIGADDHLVGLQLEKMLGVDFNFVPFGSGADARAALRGGQVDLGMMSNSEAAQFAEEIRTVAIAADERSPIMPDVPTFKEKGYDLVGGSDHVIAAPRGTPAETVAELRECVAQAAADPAFLEAAKARSLSLNIMGAEETEAFVRSQAEILTQLWNDDPWIKQ